MAVVVASFLRFEGNLKNRVIAFFVAAKTKKPYTTEWLRACLRPQGCLRFCDASSVPLRFHLRRSSYSDHFLSKVSRIITRIWQPLSAHACQMCMLRLTLPRRKLRQEMLWSRGSTGVQRYGCIPRSAVNNFGTDPSNIGSSKSLVLKSFSGEGTLWDSSLPVSRTLWDTPAPFTPPLPLPQML